MLTVLPLATFLSEKLPVGAAPRVNTSPVILPVKAAPVVVSVAAVVVS